jgi:hypothetical protein
MPWQECSTMDSRQELRLIYIGQAVRTIENSQPSLTKVLPMSSDMCYPCLRYIQRGGKRSKSRLQPNR